MLHATMRDDAVGALAGFFLPKLLKCEDFDRFEEEVVALMRSLAAEAVARCVEAFDAKLRAQAPSSPRPRAGEPHAPHAGGRGLLLPHGLPRRVRPAPNARRRAARRARARPALDRRVPVDRAARRRGVLPQDRGRLRGGDRLRDLARDRHELRPRRGGAYRSRPRRFRAQDQPGDGLSRGRRLWVHLQEPAHREDALARFLYEQARSTKSFEGLQDRGRLRRQEARGPWPASRATGSRSPARRETPTRSGKGRIGWWTTTTPSRTLGGCGSGPTGAAGAGRKGSKGRFRKDAEVSCSLDPFHIMQKICRAFPEAAPGLGGEHGRAPQGGRACAHVRALRAQGGRAKAGEY